METAGNGQPRCAEVRSAASRTAGSARVVHFQPICRLERAIASRWGGARWERRQRIVTPEAPGATGPPPSRMRGRARSSIQPARSVRDRYPERDVFTEAGAGSGRPASWSSATATRHRGRRGPPEILAFTFTERAAGRAAPAGSPSLDGARARGRGAGRRLTGPRHRPRGRATERAWITTIHGFCRRLLAADPVAARMDPRFRVLDDSEASRLRERAFSAAVEEVWAARASRRPGSSRPSGCRAFATCNWRPRTAAQPGRRSAAPA